MTLAQICIYVPMVCYAIAAADFARQGNWGMCITFSAYAVANYGLALAAKAG